MKQHARLLRGVDSETVPLIRLLRVELTAVHQQFVHFLALKKWGLGDTADRIMEVDRVDFPTAMAIIDHLVASGKPVVLDHEHFEPGASELEILFSEQAVERRMVAVIDDATCRDEVAKRLILAAGMPRDAYAIWLEQQIGARECQKSQIHPSALCLADVFSHLIATIEQAMVHAFVHWHAGNAGRADAAWATSGAAMMHATKLVQTLAPLGAVPVLGAVVERQIAAQSDDALVLDRHLAGQCAHCAADAADHADGELGPICQQIADYSLELAKWNFGEPHPATASNPPAFGSFEATLKRFVRSAS